VFIIKRQIFNTATLIILTLYLSYYFNLAVALDVTSYYGYYNALDKSPERASKSLIGPILEKWKWKKNKFSKRYKIGVLLPHVKDAYWLAINHGIVLQAKKLGLDVKILSAGGYHHGRKQLQQLTNELMNAGVDGIIISTIYYKKYDKYIEKIGKIDIPVVALVNDILAPAISAKVMTSYYDVGYEIGKFVGDEIADKNIKVAFFPGPQQASWASGTFNAFTQALKDELEGRRSGKVLIVAAQYGDLNKAVQHQLVDVTLNTKEGIDYIIGNAVAVEAAAKILPKYKAKHPNAKIISTYIMPNIYDFIKNKSIYASACDDTIELGKLSISVIARILSGEQAGNKKVKLPFRVAPKIKIITLDNINKFPRDTLFAPEDFKAVLEQ